MDMALREQLGIKSGQERHFIFQEANLWGQVCWAWRATDAMPRIAARLGVLSVVLGLVGLGLGVLSLFGGGPSVSVQISL